jgi:anti-anti-sigma factor
MIMPDETQSRPSAKRTMIPRRSGWPPDGFPSSSHRQCDLTMTVENGDALRVVLAGEFDLSRCDEFVEAIEAVYEREIEMDLGELSFIDSSAIRSLIWLSRRIDGDCGSLVIDIGSSPIARILEVSGLMNVLPIVTSE